MAAAGQEASSTPIRLQPGDGLVVVDVQNDFLPGGTLAVPRGEEVVPVLNGYIRRFVSAGLPVVLTRDWHPAGHCSFHSQGGPWPSHCVAGTPGAAFAPGLDLPPGAWVVAKGTERGEEAYSPFQGTVLDARLRSLGVARLFVGGLATDYCVLATVQDARQAGFEVLLLQDACRAVNVQADDGRQAEAKMATLGARFLTLASLGEEMP